MSGHDVPVEASNHDRFNWVTVEEGYKVLEGSGIIENMFHWVTKK